MSSRVERILAGRAIRRIGILEKQNICNMLRAFIAQRSGIDGREYRGDRQAFLSDYRRILRDGRDARRLLAWIESRGGITAGDIQAATGFNGRLEFTTDDSGRLRLDYCTGQYFPTEYRAAVCSMLSGLIWRYFADGGNSADFIRREARGYFGRGIAGRWFA